MLGHIITQFLILAVQTTVLLVFTFIVFGLYNAGSIFIIILFTLILGVMGMCLGFVISSGKWPIRGQSAYLLVSYGGFVAASCRDVASVFIHCGWLSSCPRLYDMWVYCKGWVIFIYSLVGKLPRKYCKHRHFISLTIIVVISTGWEAIEVELYIFDFSLRYIQALRKWLKIINAIIKNTTNLGKTL